MVSAACVIDESLTAPCAAATAPYLRLYLNSSGQWAIAGATKAHEAVAEARTYAVDELLSGLFRNRCGITRFIAAVAIAVGDPVWSAASGKVTNVYAEGADFIGICFVAAAADGSVVHVREKELVQKTGQHTTAAASDTIVTGLSTVLGAIATLDSAPVDDPFLVIASIGDQAGSPAAGSILINTYKNTGGTDPTPAAATTFSKKVNWLAWGY